MNLALFDFDGTITTRGTFPDFLRFATPPVRAAVGAAVLGPLLAGYKLGWVSDRSIRPILASACFRGRDAGEVRALGERFAREVLPAVVRQQALDRIAWHKRQGDIVVVVSAGLDVYLNAWCRSIGVEVVCTTLEERDGRLTGRYAGGDCCGAEKLNRIRQRFDPERHPVVYAYGDTDEDNEMLAIADEKYYRWTKVSDPRA